MARKKKRTRRVNRTRRLNRTRRVNRTRRLNRTRRVNRTRRLNRRRSVTKKKSRTLSQGGRPDAPINQNPEVKTILVAAHDKPFYASNRPVEFDEDFISKKPKTPGEPFVRENYKMMRRLRNRETGEYEGPFVERPIKETFIPHSDHWQKYLIERQIKIKYGEDVKFHIVTMDPRVEECCITGPDKDGNPTSNYYTPSVYEGPYVENNKNKFDIVFVPDIGSVYGSMLHRILSKEEINPELISEIHQFINGCLQLIKPGGFLYVGKLFIEYNEEELEQIFKGYIYEKKCISLYYQNKQPDRASRGDVVVDCPEGTRTLTQMELDVEVPEGVVSGDEFRVVVDYPEGTRTLTQMELDVEVPEGVVSGDEFRVVVNESILEYIVFQKPSM
jgi:hypothetical protein